MSFSTPTPMTKFEIFHIFSTWDAVFDVQVPNSTKLKWFEIWKAKPEQINMRNTRIPAIKEYIKANAKVELDDLMPLAMSIERVVTGYRFGRIKEGQLAYSAAKPSFKTKKKDKEHAIVQYSNVIQKYHDVFEKAIFKAIDSGVFEEFLKKTPNVAKRFRPLAGKPLQKDIEAFLYLAPEEGQVKD